MYVFTSWFQTGECLRSSTDIPDTKTQNMAGNVTQRVCLCLTVMVQLYGTMGHGIYVSHIKENLNWKEAHKKCQECNGRLIELNKDTQNTIYSTFPELNEESVWIADFSTDNSRFTFQGCASAKQIGNDHNTFNIKNNNVYLCHTMCKEYMYFAIREDRCICYDGEDFQPHCVSATTTADSHSKLCNTDFMVYSDLVLRCTFDDCRCRSVEYNQSWSESTKCYGKEGITSDRLNHNTSHVRCAVINGTSETTETVSSLTFHVPQTPTRQNMCLYFGYYMHGIRVKSLEVYLKKNNRTRENKRVWIHKGNLGNKWHTTYINITMNTPFKIVMVGTLTTSVWNGIEHYIAVDNVTVSNGDCVKIPLLFDCSFETDFCGWMQPHSSNKLRWLRNAGKTPTPMTGPSSDSRSSNGFYAYMEADFELNTSRALLLSPVVMIASFTNFCLRFSYHMYGSHANFLKLYIKQKDSVENLIWSETKPHSTTFGNKKYNKWNTVSVSFSVFKSFSVKFQAEKKKWYRADIAIDDIKLSSGMCDYNMLILCDPTERLEFCGWQNDGNTSNKWYHGKGRSYIATDFNRTKTGNSVLKSPSISQYRGWLCLELDYGISKGAALHLKLHSLENAYIIEEFFNDHGITMTLFVADRFQLLLEALLLEQNLRTTEESVKIDYILLTKGKCTEFLSTSLCDFSVIDGAQTNTIEPFTTTKTKGGTGNFSRTDTLSSSHSDVLTLQVFTSLLAILCVALVIIVMILVFSRRRNTKRELKRKEINNKSISNINYHYEVQQVVSEPKPQKSKTQCKRKIMDTDYDLAVKSVQAEEKTNGKKSDIKRNDCYQNTSFFDSDESVYKETKEWEYDQIGRPREGGNNTNDDTYDHALESGHTKHCDYDYCSAPGNATVSEDSNYFVLEKEDSERLSNIYDHAK